ncbi:MAG TPA: AraC family transcriptional regulator [Bosea sp. (in: a-proteobacteria)]|jgi:AraC-like DNA-binding protein|uniref:AraC family transcriptional regulator n=1 Tax=Bosea sp. (in: a-proteobacteria) TaxID=1871050 RepID=UPI002E13EC64|nr:AraC family transcriptional regulator [Bosea sp. (in: a-proteobacteria)]
MLDNSSRTATRDPLTEMLRGLRLEGVDYARYRMAAPWCLLFPAQAAARFHFMAERGCWLRTPEGEWHRLEQGDAVLMPRGAEHALASEPSAQAKPLGRCAFEACCGEIADAHGGGDGEDVQFFSASLCFNVDAQHPLLRMMPELMWVHEMAVHEPAIPPLLSTMSCELALDRVGAGGILTRLADVVAAALIRSWVERGCGSPTGWVAAARDPDIGRVLAAIHLDPSGDWTVEALAGVMHASRSAFAERFAAIVGETPARYVAQVRMHQARQWLVRDRMKIAVVARRLGYDSEASFSRAFKRVIGAPPSRFRAGETLGPPLLSGPLPPSSAAPQDHGEP